MFFKLKRFTAVISILLCLTLGIQMSGIALEQNEAEEFAYQKELSFLTKLGIIDEMSFDAEKELTRGEACSVVVKMIHGEDDFAASAERYFVDVPEEHRYFDAVSDAARLGIINGCDNSYFMPESPITYMQLYKMLIVALGYADAAELSGGYPAGYLKYTQNLKINDKIKKKGDENVSWADAVILIFTALDTDLCAVEKLTDSVEYAVRKGETLLTEVFSIYETSGIMTDTPISGLATAYSSLQSGNVIIGGEIYADATSADYENIGRYVKVYYIEKEGDMKRAFLITPDDKRNTERVINAHDIIDFDEKSNKYTILDKNNDSEVIAISKSADVLVNEKACPSYTKSDMVPKSGEVYLIDNNKDDKYDVVKVTGYEHYVVSHIDTINGIVYAKNRLDTLILDDEDKDLLVSLNGTQDAFSLSSLEKDTVVSVAISSVADGKRFAKILTSDKSAEGEISEVNGEFEYINLGGEIYETEKSYVEALKEGESNDIKPSRYVVLRLNAFDEITYIETDVAASKKYGFLIDIQPKKNMRENMKVKILGSDGEMKIFEVDEKITLNSTQIDSTDLAVAVEYNFAPGNVQTIRQLVSYEVTADNILKRICTYDDFSDNIQESVFARGDLFGMNNRLESSAPVFIVPNDSNINTDDVENGFMVAKASSMLADTAHNMEFFDYDDLRFAGVGIKYITFGSKSEVLPERTPLTMITKVGRAADETGEELVKITGLSAGNTVEKLLYPEKITYRNKSGAVIESYTPKKGDIIAYGENLSGYVNCVQVLYQNSEFGSTFLYSNHSSARFDGEMTVFAGNVTQFGNGIDLVIQSTNIIASGAGSAVITLADGENYRKASLSDISVGDFVVCRMRYGVFQDIMIIRK